MKKGGALWLQYSTVPGMLTVRLFASLGEAVGTRSLTMELPVPPTVEGVFLQLTREYAGLDPFRASLLVAVNQEYADWATPVAAGDEVAFFPPVSGGVL